MKKILIVEDDEELGKMWKRFFIGKLDVIIAISIVEARKLFKDHPDVIAIVLDGLVFGDDKSLKPVTLTYDLAVEFRRSFKGFMLASSSYPDVAQKLVSLGCDESCEKRNVKDVLQRFL